MTGYQEKVEVSLLQVAEDIVVSCTEVVKVKSRKVLSAEKVKGMKPVVHLVLENRAEMMIAAEEEEDESVAVAQPSLDCSWLIKRFVAIYRHLGRV